MLNGVLLVVAVNLFAAVVNRSVYSVCSGYELFDGNQDVVTPRP